MPDTCWEMDKKTESSFTICTVRYASVVYNMEVPEYFAVKNCIQSLDIIQKSLWILLTSVVWLFRVKCADSFVNNIYLQILQQFGIWRLDIVKNIYEFWAQNVLIPRANTTHIMHYLQTKTITKICIFLRLPNRALFNDKRNSPFTLILLSSSKVNLKILKQTNLKALYDP